MKDRVPRILFSISCLFLVFLYGYFASRFQWFPHQFLDVAVRQLSPMEHVGTQPASRTNPPASSVTDDPRYHYLHKARHDLSGVVDHLSGHAGYDPSARGLTLISSYWSDHDRNTGVRLIDGAGRTLHHWSLDIEAMWPESPFDDPAAGRMNKAHNYINGTYLFDNGDLLCNIELFGLMRLNARGELLWQLKRRTHHSIQRTEDGNFWVCATDWVPDADVDSRYPGLAAPLTSDCVLLVSPKGEVVREISILDLIYRSKHQSLMWTTQIPFPRFDMLHLNDVEPLSSSMAAQYPQFAAGDLLISLRALNLVMVIDPNSQSIKWSAAGLFVEQHDPDFIGEGWISVFDNRCDATIDGSHFGGSRITAVRPHTGETSLIYPRPGSASKHERKFFTHTGGRAQMLDKGHWLITETNAARVFEIDAKGNTVWEWGHHISDEGRVVEVHEGRRVALTREDVSRWLR